MRNYVAAAWNNQTEHQTSSNHRYKTHFNFITFIAIRLLLSLFFLIVIFIYLPQPCRQRLTPNVGGNHGRPCRAYFFPHSYARAASSILFCLFFFFAHSPRQSAISSNRCKRSSTIWGMKYYTRVRLGWCPDDLALI